MDAFGMSAVEGTSRPRLSPGVRLREDEARGCTILLAPERVLRPSATAIAVLRRCDGARSVEEITDELAALYVADRDRIAGDVRLLLGELAQKGVVRL
jgi:pyrroloquinoline quinone biosynthesis protein D